MNNFIEKYFCLMDDGVEHDIRKHLALGWYIVHQGLTLIILRYDTEVKQ